MRSPLFDDENSYSIGCVTIDPNNSASIWVGTGENVGGRHVAYGDGVYKSDNGGKSWKNMGLKRTEHISKNIVHPENSNVVWVAAQGPLWKKGDERGVYKTINGGENWKKVYAYLYIIYLQFFCENSKISIFFVFQNLHKV